MTEPVASRVPSVGLYEVWMLAQAAIGFCGVGGMMFLIPVYLQGVASRERTRRGLVALSVMGK